MHKRRNLTSLGLKSPTAAAIVSLLLCLPFPAVLYIAVNEIQPFDSWLAQGQEATVLGRTVVMGSLLCLPVALLLDVAAMFQRLGGGLVFRPRLPNIVVGAIIVLIMAGIVGAFVVDQWDCFRGVPNCD